jgi:UDP-N-acetylmuramate--alanine ligase
MIPLSTSRQTWHFIGIGGIGMSGLAKLGLMMGHQIQGSNAGGTALTQELARLGATIFDDHGPGRLSPQVDCVVVSSAIDETNPELIEARALGLPIKHRSDLLGQMASSRRILAVSGTHGKTTTTALLGHLFVVGGRDPMVVTGGIMHGYNSTVLAGTGPESIIEADESDKSHLNFSHIWGAVITNIEPEHMQTYGSTQALHQSFIDFLQLAKGRAVVCGDDPGIQSVLAALPQSAPIPANAEGALDLTDQTQDPCNPRDQLWTYGLASNNTVWADRLGASTSGMRFDLHGPWGCWKDMQSPLWGKHNVLNAMAAIAVGYQAGLDETSLRQGLASFAGVQRRMTVRAVVPIGDGLVPIIDDYGHHPTEIHAVLDTLHTHGWRSILAVCQPHRYSRVRDTLSLFARCCTIAQHVALLPIYGAGEAALPDVSSYELASHMRSQGACVSLIPEPGPQALEAIAGIVQAAGDRPYDCIVFLGAGTVTTLAGGLALALQERNTAESNYQPMAALAG